MPYSYVLLPGDGTTTNFTFNFGYLAKAHVHVSVDTVDTTFTWLTNFSVQISPAPGAGTVIEIRRRTPLNEPIVDWTDGTVLTEADMDLNTLFSLYAAQEAQDGVDASITQNAEGVWDGQNRSTTNFADPTDNTGLVTRGYFDNVYTPQLDAKVVEATTQASNAASSASQAQGYAIAADNSADLAAALLAVFKGQYLGPLASDPTVDGNGLPVGAGDLYFNTTDLLMKVYTGTVWTNAGSTVSGTINKPAVPVIATAGQTTVTIPGGYDAGFIIVFLNGVLVEPPEVDASSGTDIEFTAPLAVGDEVSWVAFGAFDVANAIPADGSVTDAKVALGSRLYNRSQDVTSVKDFGAVGDGVVDDTVAFQNALAWAVAPGPSKALTLPAGIYRITAPLVGNLTGTQSLALIGSGSDMVELRFEGATNGIALTAEDGNWWMDLDPGTGFFLSGFSITTTNESTGVGLSLYGGSVEGRTPRKTILQDLTFRGVSASAQTWSICTNLTALASATVSHCRWVMGGPGVLTTVGVQIVGNVTTQPTSFYFDHCEAVYGDAWITAGSYIEGIYITQCSHINGNTAVRWNAGAESGLHIVGGHYNNILRNFQLTGVFDYEIIGSLLFSMNPGAPFNFIDISSSGRGVILGNSFGGTGTGSENGIVITNSQGGATYGVTIAGNAFNNLTGVGILLSSTSSYVTVGDNGYNLCVNGEVLNLGTNNRVRKRTYEATVSVTMVGGAAIEVVNIPVPAGVFISKPLSAIIMGNASSLVGFYAPSTSTATNLQAFVRDINAVNIPAGTYTFSVMAAQ